MAQVCETFEKAAAKSANKSGAKNETVKIGIIGGSGLYHMPGLTDTREVRVKTPFGDPSDAIVVGTLEGKRVAFLARHGRGHVFSPSDINYRANICAMKMLGVERIISVSAVGSLRDDLPPHGFPHRPINFSIVPGDASPHSSATESSPTSDSTSLPARIFPRTSAKPATAPE